MACTEKCLTMSPSDVELLNDAALFPATQEGSVRVLQSSELQCDPNLPPVGTGTFSTCVKALKGGNIECVVKIPRFLDYDHFDRELTTMLLCNRHKHNHIVKLWWVCKPPTGAVALPRLVMPLVRGIVLGKWLTGEARDVRKGSVHVASQVVDAVNHLHRVVGIIHGDLSMKNILVNPSCNDHVTLVDLGGACLVDTGKRRRWVHGNYRVSPPEALSDFLCDRIMAETHVVGVLLICIERISIEGLAGCPRPFRDGIDSEEVCAIARLVQFWGRSRLYPYWNAFRRKAGDRIETIEGVSALAISDKVGVAGMGLANPSITARQSLSEILRHLTAR